MKALWRCAWCQRVCYQGQAMHTMRHGSPFMFMQYTSFESTTPVHTSLLGDITSFPQVLQLTKTCEGFQQWDLDPTSINQLIIILSTWKSRIVNPKASVYAPEWSDLHFSHPKPWFCVWTSQTMHVRIASTSTPIFADEKLLLTPIDWQTWKSMTW